MSSSHKLLMTLKMGHPQKYKELLSENETATGFPTRFKILIRNIGKNPFPGGVITDDTIDFETSFGQVQFSISFRISRRPIPKIEPNETMKLEFGGDTIIPFPGPWRMVVNIEAKDKKKIDFFQSPKSSPIAKWWSPIYAVGHHQLDLTMLLKTSLERK
jgi:hypothetical protein